MTEVLEYVGGAEDALFGPRVERDPPPTFATSTNNYTYRQWKRDIGLLQAMTALSTQPARKVVVETSERRKPRGGRGRDGRGFLVD